MIHLFNNISLTDKPLKLLLIDLSTYYVKEGDNREYNVVEPPLGLMALTFQLRL